MMHESKQTNGMVIGSLWCLYDTVRIIHGERGDEYTEMWNSKDGVVLSKPLALFETKNADAKIPNITENSHGAKVSVDGISIPHGSRVKLFLSEHWVR